MLSCFFYRAIHSRRNVVLKSQIVTDIIKQIIIRANPLNPRHLRAERDGTTEKKRLNH
jgi:hypothetical protein